VRGPKFKPQCHKKKKKKKKRKKEAREGGREEGRKELVHRAVEPKWRGRQCRGSHPESAPL
jgi:hypothetical protein